MINVIKASAGSGKTYQLTYAYIKLLLGYKSKGHYRLANENHRERHRHILAVTFTNKATGEMKERIVKELAILAGKVEGKESPYMKDLCRDFGGESVENIRNAAYRAMVDLLFDYTNFNVSTIDSFFQMILRTFARELKMSYNYDIEIDDDYAIGVGVNEFLSGLAHEHGIERDDKDKKRVRRVKSWIKEFVKNEVKDGTGKWNIFSASEETDMSSTSYNKGKGDISLDKFVRELQKEELHKHLDTLVDYLGYDGYTEGNVDYIVNFKAILNERLKTLRTELNGAVEQIFAISSAEGWTADYINRNGGAWWLKQMFEDKDHKIPEKTDVAKIRSTIAKIGSMFTKSSRKNAEPLSSIAQTRIAELLNVMADSWRKCLIIKDLHRNVFMLGLLGEINRYLSKFRQENDLILLGDTNELLRRIINNEETPFVYERVGIWLSHFLIDEFQDTSRSQWDNMKPLLYNSCAEGSDNLIIGDEKQCIYRFRNADPSLLRTEVGKQFTVCQTDGARSINWRSTPAVIDFNNRFFPKVAALHGLQEEYANVEQDISPSKHYHNTGYVEVNVIETKKKATGDDGAEEDGKSFKAIVLNCLPELVKDLVSRGYKYSDIAVLTNTKNEGNDVVNRFLQYNTTRPDGEVTINVVSNESLMLNSSPAVRLIVSHLRYLDTKQPRRKDADDAKLAKGDKADYMHRVLREYETQIFKQHRSPGEALEQCFATVPRVVNGEEESALSLKALLPDNTESFNIVSITEHIIAQNITESDLESENAFIQAFQDCVVDFSSRHNATIHEFLRWWDNGGNKTSINSPDGQNAINVLTIHKSKGLEFKCVILPFCNWDIAGKDELLWIPRQKVLESGILEGINPDYVPPILPLMPKKDMALEESGLRGYVGEKMRSRIIDGMNKTYVAFTRAVDEMYIFTPPKKLSKDKKSTSDTEMASLLGCLEFDENGRYSIGRKGRKDAEKENRCVYSKKMPLYRVNDIKMEYVTPDVYGNEQRERGTRLHNVFKRIRYKDDADAALRYYRARGVISSADYDDDRRTVLEALEDSRVQEWFAHGNRVYNERNMVKGLKKSRPDRFIVTPDGRTIVIDYKFGDKHYKSYSEQVKNYMNILAEAGFENIEGYLWYPLEKKIGKVK